MAIRHQHQHRAVGARWNLLAIFQQGCGEFECLAHRGAAGGLQRRKDPGLVSWRERQVDFGDFAKRDQADLDLRPQAALFAERLDHFLKRSIERFDLAI